LENRFFYLKISLSLDEHDQSDAHDFIIYGYSVKAPEAQTWIQYKFVWQK
jgi:hypothetical protein